MAIIAVSPVDARRVFGQTRILVPAEPVMADHLAKVARFSAEGRTAMELTTGHIEELACTLKSFKEG